MLHLDAISRQGPLKTKTESPTRIHVTYWPAFTYRIFPNIRSHVTNLIRTSVNVSDLFLFSKLNKSGKS